MKQLIKTLCKTYSLNPSKRKGQNFLITPSFEKAILNALRNFKSKSVFEIGPGFGFLTKRLLQAGYEVTAVEIDEVLVRHLKQVVNHFKNCKILHGDFLKLKLDDLLKHSVLVGNIPYSISSPILQKMCENSSLFEGAVLMFQKEFAEKLILADQKFPQTRLALLVNLCFKVEKYLTVKRLNFWPVPKVDSAILIFSNLNQEINTGLVESISKICFRFRRKTLLNNLKGSIYAENLELIFKLLGVQPEKVRGDKIDIDTWRKLFSTIKSYYPKLKG